MTPFQSLTAAQDYLSGSDLTFARSLLSQWDAKGSLSDAQMTYVHQLIERARDHYRARKAAAAPAPVQIDLTKIVELFTTRVAAGAKRAPQLLFGTTDANTVRLSTAGATARFPGSINVTSPEKAFENRTWFGRIHTDGRLELAGKLDAELRQSITAALVAFAADPEGQARSFGVRTGNCCFCATELTHGNSVTLGYGPVCAAKWGLFHTYNKAELKAEAVSETAEAISNERRAHG